MKLKLVMAVATSLALIAPVTSSAGEDFSAVCAFNPLLSYDSVYHMDVKTAGSRGVSKVARNAEGFYCQMSNYPGQASNSAVTFTTTAYLSYATSNKNYPRTIPVDLHLSASTYGSGQVNIYNIDAMLANGVIAEKLRFKNSSDQWVEPVLQELVIHISRSTY